MKNHRGHVMRSAAKHLVSPGGRRGRRGCFAALRMTRQGAFVMAYS